MPIKMKKVRFDITREVTEYSSVILLIPEITPMDNIPEIYGKTVHQIGTQAGNDCWEAHAPESCQIDIADWYEV